MSAREPRSGRSAVRPTPNAGPRTKPASQLRPAAPMRVLRGMAVSPGIAIGPIVALGPRGLNLPPRAIDPQSIAGELERLDQGLQDAAAEVKAAETDARRRLGVQYAAILGAHARMVTDPSLRRQARQRIEQDHVAAEHAVREVLDALATKLEGLPGPHLAARAADVRDIEDRILRRLTTGAGTTAPTLLGELETPSVVLAHDLSPSKTAALDPRRVLALVTEAGGRTSHTAIVAAGLEIPAVVGVGPFLESARSCRSAIVDGDAGLLILDPDAATLERYRLDAAQREARFAELANQAALPSRTRDGVPITLQCNIEFPGEVVASKARGADGVGLYRTEFLYLGTDHPPTESEQFEAYERVVRSMAGRPVTIRTLDLGADKLPGYPTAGLEAGRNPFLGLRSIRLSLRQPELFRPQLRAILRASALGDVRVMFPLIATLGEFRAARDLLRQVAAELTAEGVPVRADLPVGAMIEVPSAAIMAEELAKEVDFFSIGTNDLIQYALAVDRSDESVADLYDAADPAVLRLIAMVVTAAQRRGIEVTVCGSMGGDPFYSMLLIGMGLRQLSMPPHQLPEVKRVIRLIHAEEARALASAALQMGTAAEVSALARAALGRIAPDVLVSRGEGACAKDGPHALPDTDPDRTGWARPNADQRA